MKQIGHVDGAMTEQAWRTHSLGMLSPHDLFIPDPGERENVSADQWTLAGWVIPDKDGGTIYAHHRDASEDGDARPAYIRRYSDGGVVGEGLSRRFVMGEKPSESTTVIITKPGTIGEIDPMDVRRSEFDALTKRFDLLSESTTSRIWALEKIRHQNSDKVAAKIGMSKTYGEEGHMLTRSMDTEPSDLSMHAFQISTDDLIKEALEFCDTGLGGWDGVEVEAGCQRAGVYIRELIGRLHGARQPKPTVQAEPPMSFYDGAFIAAYMDLRSADYDDITRIQRAHAIAAKLTRNRAVPA